mgnify:FL=1
MVQKGQNMKEYNGFDSKEEYVRHTKKTLYKEGLKCMVLSVAILVLMMLLGIEEMKNVVVAIGFSEKIVMLLAKMTTVTFVIGSIAYIVSLSIKDE